MPEITSHSGQGNTHIFPDGSSSGDDRQGSQRQGSLWCAGSNFQPQPRGRLSDVLAEWHGGRALQQGPAGCTAGLRLCGRFNPVPLRQG